MMAFEIKNRYSLLMNNSVIILCDFFYVLRFWVVAKNRGIGIGYKRAHLKSEKKCLFNIRSLSHEIDQSKVDLLNRVENFDRPIERLKRNVKIIETLINLFVLCIR